MDPFCVMFRILYSSLKEALRMHSAMTKTIFTIILLVTFSSSTTVIGLRDRNGRGSEKISSTSYLNDYINVRQGCVWSNSNSGRTFHRNIGQTILVSPISSLALNCYVRTLNNQFWNSTFTTKQKEQTTELFAQCNDKLYFESSLQLNLSFSQLINLKTINIDSCKIRRLPSYMWINFPKLENLRISTHNNDWSPSINLEIESEAFVRLPSLKLLDLSQSNIWNVPSTFFCTQLPHLLTFNLSSNKLIELPDEFSSLDSSKSNSSESGCDLKLQTFDVSSNSIRRIGKCAFNRLTSLSKLYLQENYIEELEDKAFDTLNQLRLLNLSSNRLVALPPLLFSSTSNLRELYLQSNLITAISSNLFDSLSQLVILDLSYNQLTSLWIKDEVFKSLHSLIILKLNNNQLYNIDGKLFENLKSLQALYLYNNRIETIHPDAFQPLSKLGILDLSKNHLLSLHSQQLNSLIKLRSLYLDNNKLNTLERTLLDNCTILEDLGLASNELSEVPSTLRSRKLRRLRTLDLGENHIRTVNNESLFGLSELYGLRLVDNRLTEIPNGFCTSLKSLRVLNLSQNRIETVSSGAFIGCSELRALRLDTNQLKELPKTLSARLPSLLWLNVSENQLEHFEYVSLPRSVEWLDLSSNKIMQIQGNERLFRNPMPSSTFHLRVFDLSHNQLKEFDSSMIPPTIETIRLNQNQLNTIRPNTFSRSINLRRIELTENHLETIQLSALTFPPVPINRVLPELYLGGNPLVCDCKMEWLTKINHLQLSILRQHPKLMDSDSIKCKSSTNHSELIELIHSKPSQFLCNYASHCLPLCHCCDFDACDCAQTCPDNCTCFHDNSWSINIVKCSNLNVKEVPVAIPMESTELFLDGNMFGHIGNHLFIGKRNLRSLYLNNSQIQTLKNKTFNGLKGLETLNLQDNLIQRLSGWEFNDLIQLKELYLQNNLIEEISYDTFYELRFLQVLRIDGNRLVNFPLWELNKNGRLSSIMISRNSWTCDCNFVENFHSWITMKNSIIVDLSLAQCQTVVTLPSSSTDASIGSEKDEGIDRVRSTLNDNGNVKLSLTSICNSYLEKSPISDHSFNRKNDWTTNRKDNSFGSRSSSSMNEEQVSHTGEKQAIHSSDIIESVEDDGDDVGNAVREGVLKPIKPLVNIHTFDPANSIFWATILSCIVMLILVITLIILCRREIKKLFCNSFTKANSRNTSRRSDSDEVTTSEFLFSPCCLMFSGLKGNENTSRNDSSGALLRRPRIFKSLINGRRSRSDTCRTASNSQRIDRNEAEKLFDIYFIYNNEDEEFLHNKLLPELNDDRGEHRQLRICLHHELTVGLDNPWNSEILTSAASTSKSIVLLISRSFLQKEWTHNLDFQRTIQLILRTYQKKLIFILLPPLSIQNHLQGLLTLFPEIKSTLIFPNPNKAQRQFHSFQSTIVTETVNSSDGIVPENVLEWTDPIVRSKLKKLLPEPSANTALLSSDPLFSTINSIFGEASTIGNRYTTNESSRRNPPSSHIQSTSNTIPNHPGIEWPYNLSGFLKPPHHNIHQHQHHLNWTNQHLHPHQLRQGHLIDPIRHGNQPFLLHPSSEMFPPGQQIHAHQNSISTISGTDRQLSDSMNTLESIESEEHLYSTLESPLGSPTNPKAPPLYSLEASRPPLPPVPSILESQIPVQSTSSVINTGHPPTVNDQMYFV